ncbi:MAG: beta-ketoacyl-[acyl-carrier-protein] synthase family protein [Gammaproteobacteria bacterium]|nr:beta-ketoacyl-[acyl-carrier-protein] synthase family protein [Gammaproteobacteria bacterium]
MKRVVISGMGVISPAGVGIEPLWRQVMTGSSCTQRINRFDVSRYECHVAGQIDDFDPLQYLSGRLAKRTDRFTHLAMCAVEAAIQDSRLVIGGDHGVSRERICTSVGNVLGGWEFAERELRKLWVNGSREVSPYQATAWFPAAPQGNICIEYGLKGRARTFVADRASGAYAVIHGAETIRRGHADVALAGGTEAPLSPYAWLCCQNGGYLAHSYNDRPHAAYRPFDQGHSGAILGEGSAFLVLEEREHALKRGAPIYGEISGWAVGTEGYRRHATTKQDGTVLAKAIRRSLSMAELAVKELAAIYAEGSAIPADDEIEVLAIRNVLSEQHSDVPITVPKASIGHLLGASTPTDIAIALKAMAHHEVPPIANLDHPLADTDLDFVQQRRMDVKGTASLMISRGMGGVNACMVINKLSTAGSQL